MRRPSTLAALLMAVFAVMMIPSCSKPERSGPADAPSSSPAAHGSYAACLSANGVPPSAGPITPAGPPSGVSPAIWEQAMRACSTLAPGPPGP